MPRLASWLRGHPQLRRVLFPLIWLRRQLIVRPAQAQQAAFRAKLFERITNGCVTFDLPEFTGRFDIGIRSDISSRIMLEGTYEGPLAALCAETFDGVRDAIDIGANVGLYSVLLARKIKTTGRVLSLEPTPAVYDLLVRNVSRNGTADRVLCRQMAAAAKVGELVLNVQSGREEYSSIATSPIPQGAAFEQHRAIAMPVDRLCAELALEPSFVKIDVEGYEYQVLLGARSILRKFQPTLLIELAPDLLAAHGDSVPKVLGLLGDLGYRAVDAESPSMPIGKYFGGYALAMPAA